MDTVKQLESLVKSFLENYTTENISVQIYKDNWLVSVIRRKEQPIQTIVIDHVDGVENE